MLLKMRFEIDCVIDDFVFMCFFVGNDFLPHLPSLRIRDGAIDLMYMLYKHCIPQLDGYLIENGKPNWKRLDAFFKLLSKVEGELFMLRKRQEKDFADRQRRMAE